MADFGDRAASLLAAVRNQRPLVHHLANFVTMQAVASATRAVGALPVMAMAGDDAEEMAASADALVLNLGTPTPERLEAMFAAGRVATVRGIPIVLDPVGAGATRYRTVAAGRLLDEMRVTVVRANHGEAAALLGRSGFVRGVESAGDEGGAAALAAALARERGLVAAVTGACDHVAVAGRVLVIENGHPWLAAIPGAGCMVTGVIGAFCAAALAVPDEADPLSAARSSADGPRPLMAAASALACFGVAAEIAAEHARGPGTLAPALLDALHSLTPEQLRHSARVREG